MSIYRSTHGNIAGRLDSYSYFYKLTNVLLIQYCSVDKIEKNEMDVACSAYGEEERRVKGFGGET